MNAAELAHLVTQEVEGMHYKPMWTFRFDLTHDILYISRIEPNSDTGPHDLKALEDMNEWTVVGQSYALPSVLRLRTGGPDEAFCREQIRRWIRDCVHECERHEADENLWFGGERPFRPKHPKGLAG